MSRAVYSHIARPTEFSRRGNMACSISAQSEKEESDKAPVRNRVAISAHARVLTTDASLNITS